MNDLGLGKIITDANAQRDAIHIAIAPVTANDRLDPGEHIGFVDNTTNAVDLASVSVEPIGIVDPFLRNPVRKGERFWMYLYPQTITSLRHDWTHRAFKNREPSTSANSISAPASERWLRDFADRQEMTYEELMVAAKDWDENEEYYTLDFASYLEADDDFWDHYENVTGTKPTRKGSFFSCSC